MVDTVIKLSSMLSYNPPLVSYWMTIVKLSPVFQLLLDARLRIPSVLTLTSRWAQTSCSWRLQLSGTCLYWRWGTGEQRQRDGQALCVLGWERAFWAKVPVWGGWGREGRVGLACGLPFGTIQGQARGAFLGFKHEETVHVGARDVISVAEGFSGLSALSILLPPFFAFCHWEWNRTSPWLGLEPRHTSGWDLSPWDETGTHCLLN